MPLHDEGPSGEQETDFILIEGDDTDLGSQISKLKEVIQEQQADIHALPLNLERDKWIILVPGANKQVAWGSESDYGITKHMGKPLSFQKEEGGAHVTWARN